MYLELSRKKCVLIDTTFRIPGTGETFVILIHQLRILLISVKIVALKDELTKTIVLLFSEALKL